MILLSLNWTTILENSISGLIAGLVSGIIVGLFISCVGKSIWKKQFEYTNKREMYDELIPLIYDYFSRLLVIQYYNNNDEFSKSLSNLKTDISTKIQRFEAFFGEGFMSEYLKMLEIELSIKKGEKYSIDKINNELKPVLDKFKSVKNQIEYS